MVYPECDEASMAIAQTPIAQVISVPAPRDECDMEYGELLKQKGFTVKEVSVHGPDDPDFDGWVCPYRIQPAPGTQLQPGSTVTFRSAWEAG